MTISSYAAIEVSDPTLPPRLPALTCPHPPFSKAFYTSLVIDTAQRFDRIDKRSSHAHLYRNGTVLIRPYARRLRELIDYAGPLLFLDLIMVKKFVGVPVDEIIQSGGYDFSSSPLSDVVTDRNGSGVQGVRDTTTGVGIRQTWKVPTLHNFTLRDPVQLIRALPVQAPTSREVMLGVLGALVLYDFLFYLPHIAMHRVSLSRARCQDEWLKRWQQFNWLWHLHLPHHQHGELWLHFLGGKQ